ncbi:MAG: maleylpyruvate isomerase family mycothiol-dependent enzyme [Actinobacteria bacterium]|nr:maleylpyruvate isomerase family mycothiol-dependent enzyme [Actinomycetota bacterium]
MATIDIGRVTRIERREAPGLAAEEYRRMAAVAEQLSPDEWAMATECPGWTVRDVMAHVAGSMAGTSLREGARQRKLAGQRVEAGGGAFLDEMNQLHIEERAGLSEPDLARELRDRIEPAVRARRRVPGLLRRAPIPTSGDRLTLGELLDVILTRDVWMHRVDVCRATGRTPHLTPEHDGRLVADVVREWADRHGQPFTLRLTGPAGGTITSGSAGPERPELDLDAVDFCRTLSGRAPGEGLLATGVVF